MEMIDNNLIVWSNCIKRCQFVYDLYRSDQSYLCANRVFLANLKLYEASEVLYNNSDGFEDLIFLLIHLNDWFLQFEELKLSKPLFTDLFVFQRVNGASPYPKEIINKILENL